MDGGSYPSHMKSRNHFFMARIFECEILIMLILGCIGDSVGSIVQLNPYFKESNSDCQAGFLDGLDRYIYNGTLNITSQDLNQRPRVIFEMQRFSSFGFTTICLLTINPNCDSTLASDDCYCLNKPDSIVEFFLNITANTQFSNGSLRIRWPNFGASPDISNEEPVPSIYTDTIETLKVDNILVSLDKCNFHFTATHLIEWCVTGSSSRILTLNISSTTLHSQSDCINKTYIFSNAERSPIDFNASYIELNECKRTKTKVCLVNYVSSTTIASTLKTSSVQSTSNATISKELAGVLSAHIVCTVTAIIISVIVIVIILVKVQKQLPNDKTRPRHVDLLCITISLFEFLQIVLVTVAGVKFAGEGQASLEIWKIMIIYQAIVNIILLTVESLLLGIKTSCGGFQMASQALFYIVIIICIHTVIGIIAVPFLWHSCGNAGIQLKKNSPSVDRKSDSDNHGNKKTNKIQSAANSGQEMTAQFSAPVPQNLQDSSDHLGQRKRPKQSKRQKREHSIKQKDSSEIDDEVTSRRIGTASEIKLKLNETNRILESKENILHLETNTNSSISRKRPTSIEETNYPNIDLVNPRRLPPLKK
ncbi:uncharacterized protein LOC129922962 isoform X2 [Biomphalaria glabrata]|uniref:Uncharacterized protein LOC129922962 isoform X2 n=1 Tax=Biomphalaria glabrata TaxID=6526 RepID=A0A9W2YX59_BIOGL|nr:uncharacterized protein LOC129922962 isoform X2 [Biomphalaria glabrata]